LLVAHIDDITRPIEICNDTDKFDAYPYSIWHEFSVNNKVMVMSLPETVRKLHDWRTDFDRILMKNAFIAYELDISRDSGISSVFSMDDAPLSTTGALIELPSFTVDSSQRPLPLPPSWCRCDVPVLLPQPPPWPD